MIDFFWYFLSILVTLCVCVALFVFYRLIIGDQYLQSADKLKTQMMNIRKDFPELKGNSKQILGNVLGDVGIDGIMKELGIDPGILKNPLVKGLVDKYAPRVLEQLAKHGTKSQGEESFAL